MTPRPAGAPYFLVDVVPAPGRFVLTGDEGRHAAAVRRVRPGEQVVLVDGRGTFAAAVATAVGRGELTVQVGAAAAEPRPAVRVVLVQAIPKGDSAALAVDLATQAGVDEIVPWAAARSIARWEERDAQIGRAHV